MKTPMIHPPSRSLLSLLPRRLALAGAIASVACIVPAQADFSGAYAPEAWTPYPTVSDDSALVGKPATVDIAGAPGTLTLHAKQGYMWSGSTSFYLVTAPVAGTVTFDWTFESGDPGSNSVGYAVNPDIQGWGYAGQWDDPQNHSGCTQLAGRGKGSSSPANGTVSVTVNAGDRVGVYAHNAFYNGEARIIISNFSGPGAGTTLHTIDASVGVEGGGTISPQGTTVDAVDGFPKIFFIIPDLYKRISEVLVNGTAVTLPLPGATFPYYEFPAVTTDGQSIVASFTDLPIRNIAVTAGTGGSISPAGPNVSVYEGDSQTFTVTPDKYFDVTSVLVNGATEVLTGPDAATYTLANVTADGSIAAGFTEWTLTYITGKATTDGTTGIGGVVVTASGGREPYTATTAEDGTYSLRVRPDESYSVTGYRVGYIGAPESLSAGPADLTGKNFVMTVNPPRLQPMFVDRGTGGWRNDTWTIGSRIQTGASAVYVNQLGYVDRDRDGLNVSHQVGIWDQSGTLLGSVTVPAGTNGALIGDFRYGSLDAIITLQPNSTYALGGYTQGDDWGDASAAPGFNEPDFADFTVQQAIAHDGGAGFSNPNPNGGGFDWGAACAAVNLIGSTERPYDANDTDADGMPDAWEMSMVGNLTDLTKTGDFDGDGTTDYTEYRLSLIPNDGTSMFNVTIVRDPVTGDVTLTWPSQLDLKFTVQWTRDFSQANPWEDLIMLADTDGGTTESFTDTGISDEPIGFYRIVLKP
jgi:hypothetical protein